MVYNFYLLKSHNILQAQANPLLVEMGYLEHQATVGKLGSHMGLGNQVGAQGPNRHQVLQL
jgi:hypothetical protein